MISPTMMKLVETLRVTLDARLESVLLGIEAPHVRDALLHATQGGKRVRPIVTLLASSAAGGDPHRALDAATAIELLHTSSLIHDDLMDDSLLRRGIPTVHTLYNVPTAILAGDTLIAFAFELIQALEVPASPQIAGVFSRAFRALCEGQAYDLYLSSGHAADPAIHRTMVEKKTAALFRAAAEIGALHSTDDRATVQALARFGHYLGMAFQAQDDLLDLVGCEEIMGKPRHLDRRNGRQTYVTLLADERDEPSRTVATTVQHFTEEAVAALSALPTSDALEMLVMLARSLQKRES